MWPDQSSGLTDHSSRLRRARRPVDLHFSQKWSAVWPELAALPAQGLTMLDAGCGDGTWCMEIARQRPGWQIHGIDRDAAAIAVAEERRRERDLDNLRFTCADYDGFGVSMQFDLVLSICSAHYVTSAGDATRLFRHIRGWLNPAGCAVMLLPRTVGETPFTSALAHPAWHMVYSRHGLLESCAASQLRPQRLRPCIGRLGTVAKQLDWARSSAPTATAAALAVVAHGLAFVGALMPVPPHRSLMWLLVAERSAT